MRFRLGVIILFLSTIAFAQVISVRPYNQVTKKATLNLSDLISADGLNPETVQALQLIKLGKAPKLGGKIVLTAQKLAMAIRVHKELRGYNFQIPHRITIVNNGYAANAVTIRRKLLAAWQPLCDDCKLVIKNLQMPVIATRYANDKWILDQPDAVPRGHFAQKLIFMTAGREPVIYWVNGELEIRKRVPVLTRSIYGGMRLTANDFKFEWRDVTYATDSSPNAKQMLGHQIAAMMTAGQIIWRSSLVREKAVQYGQIVRVTSGAGLWQVSLLAKAEQAGFVGDLVNVRNTETKKVFSARVVGPGLVELQ